MLGPSIAAGAAFAALVSAPLSIDGLADPSALTYTGTAGLAAAGGPLRLTPDVAWRGGSAFWQCPITLDGETTLAIYLEVLIAGGRDDGKGADGLAWVLQASSAGPAALGGKGGQLAFMGVAPAIGIELDTWKNPWDANDNHVGLVSSQMVAGHVKTAKAPIDLNAGEVVYVWIEYTGPAHRLEVRVSGAPARPSEPLLAALAAEGIVRAKNLILPTPQAIEQAQAFRIFKWRNYRRNEQGFRDDPIMSPKATNTYRVLCIGDSYTEGWGIAREEDRLTEIMQKQLVAPPPIAARVEVLNAGIAGAHTASQADALDDLLALQPDYVLLIYCFNDIDHAKSGAGTTSRRSKWSPSYLIRSNFHCGMETYARARDILYRYENEKSLATAYDDPLIMSAHLERLVTIFDTCKQHKVPAVLVPFDHSITLGPRYLKRHDTLVSAAATAGINVWRTDHLYGERAFRDLVVSSLDAHPNEQAHRLMGVELARRLRESLKTD